MANIFFFGKIILQQQQTCPIADFTASKTRVLAKGLKLWF